MLAHAWRRRAGGLAQSTEAFDDRFFALGKTARDLCHGPCGVALAHDMLVLAKPQNERDFSRSQPCHPGVADELAVAHERGDLDVGKRRAQAIEQVCPRPGVRVARRRQQRPDQRNAHAVPDDRNHQDVDRRLAELPVRAIHRQRPRLAAYAEQIHDHARRHGAIDLDVLEEPIEPSPHRVGRRRRRHMRGEAPQADRPAPHDQKRQPRQRLAPCRREGDVLGYRLG